MTHVGHQQLPRLEGNHNGDPKMLFQTVLDGGAYDRRGHQLQVSPLNRSRFLD